MVGPMDFGWKAIVIESKCPIFAKNFTALGKLIASLVNMMSASCCTNDVSTVSSSNYFQKKYINRHIHISKMNLLFYSIYTCYIISVFKISLNS
jgi:hypothetical protein